MIKRHDISEINRTRISVLDITIGHLASLFSKHYSIYAVSETMNKSCKYVVSVLKRNNYNIYRGFSTPLSEEMLNVLADDYVNTQHFFFNQAISGLVKKPEKIEYFFSFRKLFKHDDYADIEYAESWEQIDEDKIRQTFIYGVDKHKPSNNGQKALNTGVLLTGKSHLARIISEVFGHCISHQVPTNDYLFDSYFGGERIISSQEEFPELFYKKQTESDYKLYVLNILTSNTDPTSVKSKLLTPLTQRASSGFFVRHVLLPHRYCIFGTSDDDDHQPYLYSSECKPDYMNCYAGWGNAIMLPYAV